jgi:hypothetical protein
MFSKMFSRKFVPLVYALPAGAGILSFADLSNPLPKAVVPSYWDSALKHLFSLLPRCWRRDDGTQCFPLDQLDINDRFSSTWSLQRGHHLYLYRRRYDLLENIPSHPPSYTPVLHEKKNTDIDAAVSGGIEDVTSDETDWDEELGKNFNPVFRCKLRNKMGLTTSKIHQNENSSIFSLVNCEFFLNLYRIIFIITIHCF